MDQLLTKIKKSYQSQGGTAIAKLSKLLEDSPDGVGQSIISEYNFFKGHSISMFNSETERHGIDYVLKELRGD